MKTSKTKTLLAAAILAAPVLITGCLKADLLLDLKQDGSGYLEAEYTLSETSINQIKSMVKLSQDLDKVSLGKSQKQPPDPAMLLFLDPDETKIRSELEKYSKFGLSVNKLRVRSSSGQRTVDMKLEFNSIADLARADFFSDIGFSLYRQKSGDLVFHRKSMGENKSAANIFDDENARRLIAPILEGFMVTVRIQPPGRILESNADSSGVSSATWTFDQEKDAKAFQRLQNQEFTMLIDSTGVKIPDIKIVRNSAAAGGGK